MLCSAAPRWHLAFYRTICEGHCSKYYYVKLETQFLHCILFVCDLNRPIDKSSLALLLR